VFGDYEVVIGLEIHAQLLTDSKLFSSAATEFGAGDNENVNFVCAGLPGTLPVLNQKVLELAVKTGLALNCKINNGSTFARKQYFYPDLPKGYQISQLDLPICGPGYVEFYVDDEKKKVHLERAHLEEDAGKSTHFGEYTLINLNRAGVPLLEIVSAPEMRAPKEAAAYAKAVRQILLYAETCNGNLEEGSLRCDCNVSVRKKGETRLGTRVEIKNINSFRFIEKAIEYEAKRQIDCLVHGESLVQETRLYDATKNKTFSMRTKEEADDYRYFQDPDILPALFPDNFVETLRGTLGEMPLAKMSRFQQNYELARADCEQLCGEKEVALYFETLVAAVKDPKLCANWILGEWTAKRNESRLQVHEVPVDASEMGVLLCFIKEGTLSGKMAKVVFEKMWETQGRAQETVEKLGLKQITDAGVIEALVRDVVEANPEKVEAYLGGKEKLYGFFVGQIMKKTNGQASPEVVNTILKKQLQKALKQ